MFKKILIANRGEIAVRVMRTARAMGIATVAVYSDADERAAHVAMADEAYRIGPAAASESYLQADRIIEVAKSSGAEAIHPGYGFLSENAEFAESCAAAGIAFIGPSASAIRAMGLKDAAKTLMEEAGVPVVPGYHGDNQDDAFLKREAASIGYPVLIKARAGGGGKGMRLVEKANDFTAALTSARGEAAASFGDDHVLVEKFIANPRHIEVQVFGDSHGNVVHLFERDCSLQRRHQKVIEEAPAPGMTDVLREAMGKAAVEAARAVNYVGAGTVEFIVDGGVMKAAAPDCFWFMEMNTRLQVEHPVTEKITGQDLVEWQLLVASGERLPCGQHELSITGHAFEARLYAEDPERDFMPSIGRLQHLHLPAALADIHSGIREGDAVTPFYDPMIAKLVVHGQTRAAALNKLSLALAGTRAAGCATNIAFLAALAGHDGFAAGEVDTGFIAAEFDILTAQARPSVEIVAAAALRHLGLLDAGQTNDPFDSLPGWRHWSGGKCYMDLDWRDETLAVTLTLQGNNRFVVEVMGETLSIGARRFDSSTIEVTSGGKINRLHVTAWDNRIMVFEGARSFVFEVPDPLAVGTESGVSDGQIRAPLPGLVRLVHVADGASVVAGDDLIIIEAMKMQHVLGAPCDGVVSGLSVVEGDQVAEGDLLMSLEALVDREASPDAGPGAKGEA